MTNKKIDRPYADFGCRLLNARKQANLTQEGLSNNTKISVSSISLYENGKTFPHPHVLTKLAEILKTDLSLLVFGKPCIVNPYVVQINSLAEKTIAPARTLKELINIQEDILTKQRILEQELYKVKQMRDENHLRILTFIYTDKTNAPT